MSSIRMRSFTGPTQHLALRHPFATQRSVFKSGVPIGIDVFSHEVVYFDPVWMKQQGIIDSMMFALFGIKGYGKSSALKIFALRYADMTSGMEETRIAINDHKVLRQDNVDGAVERGMEYDSLAYVMGCKPFIMSNMRVNPFTPRICKTYSQLLAMATLLAGFSTTDRMDVRTKRALRVAVFKMFRGSPYYWSPLTLLDIIRTLCAADVDGYNVDARQQLADEHVQRMGRLSKRLLQTELGVIDEEYRARRGHEVTISTELTLDAKEKLFDLMDDVFSGPDAGIFGDSHDIFDMYGQRASVKQWIGFAPGGMGETMMRSLDSQLRITAIENDMMELLPHVELDDERHKSIENPINAKTSAYLSKIARSLPWVNLSATQRPTDLLKGEIGSEHYRWGESIINDLGGVFLGRQRGSKEQLDEIQERYMLTDSQRGLLPILPKYHMFIKGSEEYPATLMRVFATEPELELLKTDQSNERLLRRPGILNLQLIEEYAGVNGVKLIGKSS